MPMTQPVYEEITLTTNPVEISWTVTETTIVDEYEIELSIDLGVKIPEPKLGSTMPWFTIAKNMQSAAVLETKIVNNSLIDVIDAVAVIDGNVSGISVVGGGHIGTIPAMSNVTVQLLVQPGYYDLPTFAENNITTNKVLLRVTGSYVSFDEDTGLPVYPAKTTEVKVPIYNPGKQKVNMEIVTSDGNKEQLEIQMPDDSGLEELDYFIFKEETGERIKKDESASGGVYEVVKLSLSQTASLERQAFDAELKITNNYPSYALENLTTEVVIQYTDPVTNEVSYITDNVYVIMTQGSASSSVASGSTYNGKWKIIPGIGMGGEQGRKYQVFARISYTASEDCEHCAMSVGVSDMYGGRIFSIPTLVTMDRFSISKGTHEVDLVLPKLTLSPGTYLFGVHCMANGSLADWLEYAVKFNVIDDDFYGTGRMIGSHLAGKAVLCEHSWRFLQ